MNITKREKINYQKVYYNSEYLLKARKFIVFITILIIYSKPLHSQHFDLGSWNIVNVKYNINQKWSFFGEAQIRSLKFYKNFHYHEYKGAISFKANKSVNLTLGAGDYDTYKEDGSFVPPKKNDEFRLWPQVTFIHPIGNVKMEHRYRAELRFTSSGFRNRFRYRFGAAFPFGKSNSGYKRYHISFSNELFFTGKEPYFERNRALASFGYRMTKQTTFQLGYLQQFDYKINDETGRDFLQLGLFIEIFPKDPKK